MALDDKQIPGTTNAESIQADEWYTVDGTTVSDIATAVTNNRYIKLRPEQTYTHDGSSTITQQAGDGRLYVDASTAEIQVRGNPVVDIDETSLDADNVYWEGGVFSGSQSAGEVAFDISDSVHNRIRPTRIEDCEVGIAMFNENLWCEYNEIKTQGERNECLIAQIGQDGSPPAGSSLRTPAQNGGTGSFRFNRLYLRPSPVKRSNLTTAYGLYQSDANFYASTLEATFNVDTDVVAWRIHGSLNGSRFHIHSETAGSRTDGTGFVVDSLDRPPLSAHARIGQAGGTTAIVNNTSVPFMWEDNALTDGGVLYGPRILRDGTPIKRYVDGQGGDPRTEYVNGHVIDMDGGGSAAAPAIRFDNADGLFATGSGMAAVDDGNSAMMYLRPFSSRPLSPKTVTAYLDDGTGANAAGWWLTTNGGSNWTQL